MSTERVTTILTATQDWPTDELKDLREQIERVLLDRVVEQMREEGLIRKKKRPLTPEEIQQINSWQPIKIDGPPLSEDIIADRR